METMNNKSESFLMRDNHKTNYSSLIFLSALGFTSIILASVTIGFVSRIQNTQPSYLSSVGFTDTTQKTSSLVASSSNQHLYELRNPSNSLVGIKRRVYESENKFWDVDFITNDINVLPYAGLMSGTSRQYTQITNPRGDILILSPNNYVDYLNTMNRTIMNTNTQSINLIYNGVANSVVINRNSQGGLFGVALQPLNPEIKTFLEGFSNLNPEPLRPLNYNTQVNDLCVVMHCGVSGLIDIASCVVEITGSAGTVGWLICAGQSILAGCSCLQCWGYCNDS